jgi:hypothetical protein
MLWKLPLPVSGGLQYWTEQMASRAAFEVHRELVTDVYLPYLYILNPIIFLAELCRVAHSWARRAPHRRARNHIRVALVARHLSTRHSRRMAVVLHIPCDHHVLVCAACRRRSLGLDAWLRRHVAAVRDGKGFLGALLHMAG